MMESVLRGSRVIEAVRLLLIFDILHGNYRSKYQWMVRQSPKNTSRVSRDHVLHTVELACAFYWKRVLCLQRSAVLSALLRRQGFRAEVVIGAQRVPFSAHAWVEIDGEAVGESDEVILRFVAMDRIGAAKSEDWQ